ncbi:DUF4824 family protein [Atopomonas sediminilitoris]|uniref:DUF4824 family protein n=1 Tax=Atopomonas sediminilitoris TaxID=2919919 RepID=UPI001F4EF46F|nr:DUF4824 family protein [Atopomonas sediminilitoris]MCJ8169488.1 DUF4824 family protein [Atopomonas sediminilitoris]
MTPRKPWLTGKRTLLLALALMLGCNALLLAGVAYNRSGVPDSVLTLSERELMRDSSRLLDEGDDSSLRLELQWRYPHDSAQRGYYLSDWLSRERLHELGFSVPAAHDRPARRQYQRQLSRTAYLVLEFDGPAYQALLQHAHDKLSEAKATLAKQGQKKRWQDELDAAEEHHQALHQRHSRLVLIDADLSAQRLRQRYADRSRYLIVPGQLAPRLLHPDRAPYYSAQATLLNPHIQIPTELHAALQDWPERWTKNPLPQRVQISTGQRYESWLSAVLKPPKPAP